MTYLRTFRDTDWMAWAGAERFGTVEPMIYDEEPTFVLTLGGCPDEGCPMIFILVNDPANPEDANEYIYLPLPHRGWTEAQQLAETLIERLKAPDDSTWALVRELAKYI